MRSKRTAVIGALLALVVLSACGRSSGNDAASKTKADGSLAKGDFGSLKAVCGPGPGGNATSGVGLTPTDISLGTISDPGSSIRPGLNQEIFNASEVFVSWCNSLGGINGHTIKLDKLDAQLFQHKQRIVDACQNDFALVGGGGVFDDAGQDERVKCLLPQFPAFLTTDLARSSDLTVQEVPTPIDSLNIGTLRWLRTKFPDATKVAILTGSVPSLIGLAKELTEVSTRDLSAEVVYNQQYNSTGEATWVPFAQALKSSGAQAVIFIGEPTDFAKLAQAFDLTSYTPTWVYPSTNIYDKDLLDLAGAALHNVYVPAATVPFEAAGQPTPGGKAMQDYLDLAKQYLPDADVQAVLAVHSFSAWLLFATAAKACGANVDRKCVYENAKKITTWDGGGLTAPSNPNGGKGTACSAVIQASAQGFKPINEGANTDGTWFCDPANVVAVTPTSATHGPQLADFGKTVNDLP